MKFSLPKSFQPVSCSTHSYFSLNTGYIQFNYQNELSMMIRIHSLKTLQVPINTRDGIKLLLLNVTLAMFATDGTLRPPSDPHDHDFELNVEAKNTY